jgi:hypothetical protein
MLRHFFSKKLKLFLIHNTSIPEPLTIGFDSRIGKVFILILEGLDLAFLVTIGSVFVHLETANCGGGPLLGLGIIAAVGVVGVLWFSRDVNGSLFLLRHCRDREGTRRI